MEKIVDIRPTEIESAIVRAPFDKAFESLIENGYDIISLKDNAKLRIQQGRDAYISRNANWTREGVLYIPKEKPKLVRNSPILESAKQAIQAHRKGKDFYPTKEQTEQSLTYSVNFPEETIKIPTDRFDSEALTVYAFGGENEARTYGEFLREVGIKDMPIYAVNKNYVNRQGKTFARQMWFGAIDDWSVFGCYWGLKYDIRLRGVK